MNIQKIWEDAKKEMHGRVSQVSFDLWIKPLSAVAFEEGEFILAKRKTNGTLYI